MDVTQTPSRCGDLDVVHSTFQLASLSGMAPFLRLHFAEWGKWPRGYLRGIRKILMFGAAETLLCQSEPQYKCSPFGWVSGLRKLYAVPSGVEVYR